MRYFLKHLVQPELLETPPDSIKEDDR